MAVRLIDANALDFGHCRGGAVCGVAFVRLEDVAHVVMTAPTLTTWEGADFDPKTNADRIRRMSDEELAKQLYDMQKQLCVYFAKTVGFPVEELQFQEDAPDILNWLQQSVEEDT